MNDTLTLSTLLGVLAQVPAYEGRKVAAIYVLEELPGDAFQVTLKDSIYFLVKKSAWEKFVKEIESSMLVGVPVHDKTEETKEEPK